MRAAIPAMKTRKYFRDSSRTIRSYIDLVMPVYYEYDVLVSDDPDEVIDLPEKRVHSESLFISGNTTEYSPVTVKLFYWVNE